MSYVEQAIYEFLKEIYTRGIIVLTNKRFLLYTSIAIFLPIILTSLAFVQRFYDVSYIYDILFKLELATCAGLVITGLVSLKIQLVGAERAFFLAVVAILFGFSFMPINVVNTIEDAFVFGSFYSWIITTNLSVLLVIREFMVSWPGWVVRLGDKEDRLTFSPMVRLGIFASLAWFTYSVITSFSWTWLMAFIAGIAVIYTIYIFMPVTKDSILATIISFFYFTLLYHLFVRAESSTGLLLLDIVLIVASTIFTAQSVTRVIERKKGSLPYHWDSLIILLLGFMLGYHLLAIRIAQFSGLEFLYSIYHDIAFGFGTLTILGVLLLYAARPKFREFSTMQVSVGGAVKKGASLGLDAIKNYASNLKDAFKQKRFKFEVKKKDDDIEF